MENFFPILKFEVASHSLIAANDLQTN